MDTVENEATLDQMLIFCVCKQTGTLYRQNANVDPMFTNREEIGQRMKVMFQRKLRYQRLLFGYRLIFNEEDRIDFQIFLNKYLK